VAFCAGVVDSNVKVPKTRYRLIDKVADILFVSYVSLDELGVGSKTA
jgi:predicted HAD superfamily Cof-like phosphohydrolase